MTKLNESLQSANNAPVSNIQQSVTEQVVMDYFFHQELDNKLSEAQKSAFIATCIMTGLNPIKKEIYAIPRWDRQKNGYSLTTVTSYQTYIVRASRNNKYRGFKLESTGKGNDLAITCNVYVEGYQVPISATAHYAEYNTNTHIWKTKPNVMLEKVAISRAMRWAFPEELESMPYTTEEMGDAVIVENRKDDDYTAPLVVETQPTATATSTAKAENKQPESVPEQKIELTLSEKAWKEVQDYAKPHIKSLSELDILKIKELKTIITDETAEGIKEQAMLLIDRVVEQNKDPQYSEEQTKEANDIIHYLHNKYDVGIPLHMADKLRVLEDKMHVVEFAKEFEQMIIDEFKGYCKNVRKMAGGDMVFEKSNHKTGLSRINRMTLKNCDEVVQDWAYIESKIKDDEKRLQEEQKKFAESFMNGSHDEPPF